MMFWKVDCEREIPYLKRLIDSRINIYKDVKTYQINQMEVLKMTIQTYVTSCDNCGGEAKNRWIVGFDEINIDFMSDMELECPECGYVTWIEIEKNLRAYK